MHKSRRHLIRSAIPTLCAAAVAIWLISTPAQAAGKDTKKSWREFELTDEAVNKAIDKGVEYLWSKMDPQEFHWQDKKQADFSKAWKDKDELIRKYQRAAYAHDWADWGARTALVLMALHKAGVSRDEPRYAKSLAWLAENPAIATYPNAFRAILFSWLEHGHRKQIRDGKDWLLSAIYASGGTGYMPPWTTEVRMNPKGNSTDLSNTQYAVLAGWALDDAGAEVPDKYWKLVQKHFLDQQNKDGGWGYGRSSNNDTYQTMTMAGLASQFIVWDKLHAKNCRQNPDKDLVKSIEAGLAWVDKNFRIDANPGKKRFWLAYNLYGIERVGVASGLKYLGDSNWYIDGAKFALHYQHESGEFRLPDNRGFHKDRLSDTAYVLMFLAYGRAPVVFNKLAYDSPPQWNSHPRDLARLTTWMGNSYERIFNWQVMPIARPVHELLDAPILLMSGQGAIDLDDASKLKLKEYILGGGLLLGDPANNSMTFIRSFQQLMAELFGELELVPLERDHLVYTIQHPLDKMVPGQRPAPKLMGLTNGIRLFAILSLGELGCTWQTYDVARGRPYFELAANLMLYVSDKGSGLLGRGNSYGVQDLGNKPAKSITVGRVAWPLAADGTPASRYVWDPEPAAWTHLDVHLRNAGVLAIDVKNLTFAQPVAPADVPVVHLTGLSRLALTDAQKANLKKYVADGGLLLVDAAGGGADGKPSAFAASFEKLAPDLFGQIVPAVVPFAAEATDDGKVAMRHVGRVPRSIRPLEVQGIKSGDRWGVLYLPYDLTAALVGYPNVEPTGLSPESARKFATALLTWKQGSGLP